MASRRRVLLAGLVAFVASVAVVGVSADCQPCDSIYDRCLPACNGMSSCQTRCMQSHFDCRMQVPGCFKATLEAEAEAEAAAIADPTPTPAECYTSCAATYSKCTQACKPGDVACYAQCTTTYQQECLPKCGMPAPPSPPSPPSPSSPPSPPSPMTMTVKGVRECLKECKAKGKEANDKCKAEKWIKRGDCYAKVPNMVKACESGCNRKPHGLEFVPSTLTSSSSVSDRPISPSECIANCGYALTVCLKNVDDWCAPTVWGASCHNQGQLQCKMDNNGCQTACQLAPGLAAAETDASVEEEKKQKSIPSRPLLGDCQPCDSIYDACLPACNGMSNCQLKCMQNHFDCRMATPGC